MRKIILMGFPLHRNLGDQAIALAEEKFIKEYRKMNEENRKFLEENDLPYIEISGEDN